MKFHDELQNAVRPFYQDAGAIHVVTSLLGAVRTIDAVVRDQVDEEVKSSAVQILFDLTASLNSNPFWVRHSGYIMPVFTNSVAGWINSYNYAKAGATPEEKATFLVARNVLAETAIAVLYCERGAKGLLQDGARLREVLMDLRM
ncbi:MAG: hypothetical protein ACK5MY_02530 [Jhaorihella sp.]